MPAPPVDRPSVVYSIHLIDFFFESKSSSQIPLLLHLNYYSPLDSAVFLSSTSPCMQRSSSLITCHYSPSISLLCPRRLDPLPCHLTSPQRSVHRQHCNRSITILPLLGSILVTPAAHRHQPHHRRSPLTRIQKILITPNLPLLTFPPSKSNRNASNNCLLTFPIATRLPTQIQPAAPKVAAFASCDCFILDAQNPPYL